ncbi:unnamed protein product [Rotaria magnacalcarata]|uniref:Uncharacterized protein n=1 Tax=Rotaria magnacalcarata TaxID=392030 RepID=A0A816RK79_9BILA|nr:unnamed protein product [Rotaria magnacalcarata]CAF3751007.1 unnamed protein product [Rotaria magnacalcarata]
MDGKSIGFGRLINDTNSSRTERSGLSSTSYQSGRNPLYDNHDSADRNTMTLDVVHEFKRTAKNKIQRGCRLTQPIIELEVTKIKANLNPDENDIEQWRNQLPRDIRNCPDCALRVSMAYGDNPQQIKSVIQSKMSINPTDNINATVSFDNLIEPLKKLNKDLESNPMRNLFFAVHNITDPNMDRLGRLFLSEARHFTPSLQSYQFENAHRAVEAIRDIAYESSKPQELLVIIKTLDDADDIRDYLNRLSNESIRRSLPTRRPDNEYANQNRYASTSHINQNPLQSPGHQSHLSRETPTNRDRDNSMPKSEQSRLPYHSSVFFPAPSHQLPKQNDSSTSTRNNDQSQASPQRTGGKSARSTSRDNRNETSQQSPLFDHQKSPSQSSNQRTPTSDGTGRKHYAGPAVDSEKMRDPGEILAQFTAVNLNRHDRGSRDQQNDNPARREQRK